MHNWQRDIPIMASTCCPLPSSSHSGCSVWPGIQWSCISADSKILCFWCNGLFLVGLWQQMGCLPVQLIGFGCTHVANGLFTSIWVCIWPYTQEVQVKSVMFMGFAHIYTWVMWHIYKEMYVQDGSWYVDMGCCMLVCMSQCSLDGRLVWSHAWLNASICGSMQNLYCKSQMLFVAWCFLMNK